jgi:hypothetical protein
VSEQPAQGSGHDFVRPFIMTRGRTKASRTDLRFETLVQRADDGPIDATVPSEQVAILQLAADPISVAELAAGLQLVIGVVSVLINDLLDSQKLVMHGDGGGIVDDDDEFDVLNRIANKIRTL